MLLPKRLLACLALSRFIGTKILLEIEQLEQADVRL